MPPPHTPLLIEALALAIAALMGYTAHRASLCNVRAVLEIMSSRSAFMLGSFVKAALWATLLYGTVIALSPWTPIGFQTQDSRVLVLFGGFVFGAGAAVNGGCSLSTLQRLADGELGMLLTLLGLGLGLLSWSTLDLKFALAHMIRVPVVWHDPGSGAMALLALLWLAAALEVRRLWRSRPNIALWKLPAIETYRLSTAAAIIGTSGGLLSVVLGPWTYTYYLRASIHTAQHGTDAPRPLLAWLLAALLIGMVASAVQRASFRIRCPRKSESLQRLAGGVLMGFGAALIPGGNDTVLLTGIPTLSSAALAAYAALLLGIATTLRALRATGTPLPVVACTGDTCTSRTEGGVRER